MKTIPSYETILGSLPTFAYIVINGMEGEAPSKDDLKAVARVTPHFPLILVNGAQYLEKILKELPRDTTHEEFSEALSIPFAAIACGALGAGDKISPEEVQKKMQNPLVEESINRYLSLFWHMTFPDRPSPNGNIHDFSFLTTIMDGKLDA